MRQIGDDRPIDLTDPTIRQSHNIMFKGRATESVDAAEVAQKHDDGDPFANIP
jgi:hypothetical protein